MKRTDHPLYARGVALYLAGGGPRLARLLDARRLGSAERKLLSARLSLRNRDVASARQAANEASTASSPFLRAEAAFISAQTAYVAGDFELAAIENLRAYEAYRAVDDRRGMFLAQYNLGVDYGRLGLFAVAHEYYVRAGAIAEGAAEKTLVERAVCCELSRKGLNAEAAERIAALEPSLCELGPGDLATHCAVAADLYARAGRYADAEAVILRALSGTRGLERARLELDRALVRWRQGKAADPRVSPAIAGHEEYRDQWRLARDLRAGALTEAQATWARLAARWPGKYGAFLEPVRPEDKGELFFAAIAGIRGTSATSVEVATNTVMLAGKLRELFALLRESPAPLRKEEIIERLWGVNYAPSYDSRFYKLLERLRRAAPALDIVCSNRAYTLKPRA